MAWTLLRLEQEPLKTARLLKPARQLGARLHQYIFRRHHQQRQQRLRVQTRHRQTSRQQHLHYPVQPQTWRPLIYNKRTKLLQGQTNQKSMN
jgi:hypothetical protein